MVVYSSPVLSLDFDAVKEVLTQVRSFSFLTKSDEY